ncbi:hypothetical protein K6V78_02205 [Streptococcus gallolyticus]|nr:hypothetical protein [Streptococcus gallolyticus]MBY5040452.1 hypothetical protein [Streptococcus gallolyticus]
MYASPDYYKKTFVGVISADADDLDSKLESASDKIDMLTFNRIRGIGFDNLTTFQQEVIQKVCCQIVDFEEVNADLIATAVSSYSINGVSMQFGSNWNVVTEQGIAIYRKTYELLKQTGLTRRII